MGAEYSRKREERKEADRRWRKQLHRQGQVYADLTGKRFTRQDYVDGLETIGEDQKRFLTDCWENGVEKPVTCDGNGHTYGRAHCGISFLVFVKQIGGQAVVLYPEGTGGCIYRDPENPRIRKRDFCSDCSKGMGFTVTRILIGSVNDVAYDLL